VGDVADSTLGTRVRQAGLKSGPTQAMNVGKACSLVGQVIPFPVDLGGFR